MRALELGSYVSVAYAGMVLAEQGHEVIKWTAERPDPILGLHRGAELWDWINHGKKLATRHASQVVHLTSPMIVPKLFDVVLDNIRASTWESWGVDPAVEAKRLDVTWVSLRDDFDGRSFDAYAQARAWGDHVGYIPTYIGDTTAGLWMAFKALAAPSGHHVLRQAACLAKLVEGEGVVTAERDGVAPPWDEPGTYGPAQDGVGVIFREEAHVEPFRDEQWRRDNLRHDGTGRYVV